MAQSRGAIMTVALGYVVLIVAVAAFVAYGLGLICGVNIRVYLDRRQGPR